MILVSQQSMVGFHLQQNARCLDMQDNDKIGERICLHMPVHDAAIVSL